MYMSFFWLPTTVESYMYLCVKLNVWYFDTFHDLEKNGVVDGGGWVPEKSKTLNLHYN